MIKYVLLDLDNTLLDFDKATFEVLTAIFDRIGKKYDKELHYKFLQNNDEFWKAHERGEITVQYIKDNRFKKFFADNNINSVDFKEIETSFRHGIANSVIKVDNAQFLLDYLYGKYKLYIVSNGVAATQYSRMEQTGWRKYFQIMFFSEEVGCQKPQKEFFEYCFQTIGDKNLSSYIIIGDNPNSDIAGGKNAGITTCFFNKNKMEKLPENLNADYIISDLGEITDIL